jgi:hypothetical protein
MHSSFVIFLLIVAGAIWAWSGDGGAKSAPPPSSEATSWCSLWQGQKICGSQADFDLFAERTCLKTTAREHDSPSQLILGWGTCAAAKVMAVKIAIAAEQHNNAIAAQKRFDELPPGPAWGERHGR